MKSHTGFRLMPTSVTLSDLKRVIALILRFFTECDSFAGQLRDNG